MVATPRLFVFACRSDAGVALLTAALFNRAVDPYEALGVAWDPAPGSAIDPVVARCMAELGIDLSRGEAATATDDLPEAQVVVMLGDELPLSIAAARQERWPLPPPGGARIDHVRAVRDALRDRVFDLVSREDLAVGRT